MDLLLRDAGGEPRRIMQADESVYLHPARAKPGPDAMVVGEVSAATEAFAAASEEALLAAALGCADEAGFLAALRRARDYGE